MWSTKKRRMQLKKRKRKAKKHPQMEPATYLESLKKLFLEKAVREDETLFNNHNNPDRYYWKWVTTQAVAQDLGVPYARVRHYLHKLKEQGLVQAHLSKRGDKMVLYHGWAATEVPGFKEHENFKDYRRGINKFLPANLQTQTDVK